MTCLIKLQKLSDTPSSTRKTILVGSFIAIAILLSIHIIIPLNEIINITDEELCDKDVKLKQKNFSFHIHRENYKNQLLMKKNRSKDVSKKSSNSNFIVLDIDNHNELYNNNIEISNLRKGLTKQVNMNRYRLFV